MFGAGAIGSLLGALLSRTHRVTLIGRADHVAAVRGTGLHVQGNRVLVAHPAAATTIDGLATPDLVLLTVKSHDTAPALAALAPLMGPKTILLVAQNGLGNWEQAQRAFPKNHVLAASVMYGAMLLAPGRVAWNGPGEITIGATPQDAGAVEAVRAALEAGGVSVHATENISGALWLKAIVNAAINPLTALHRVPNGTLLQDPGLRQTLAKVAQEAAAVARAEGVRLPVPDPVTEVERVTLMTRDNRSSMLQSVEKGLPLEIEAITGAILEAAARHGLPCPENRRLYEAIKKLGSANVGR